MYDIEELEKKWLKYRRRKIIVVASSAILATSIIGGVSYLIVANSKSKPTTAHQVPKDEDIIVKREKKTPSSITPEVPSMEQSSYKRSSYAQSGFDNGVVEPPKQTHKKINMIITEPKSGSVIKEIEDRFESTKSYDDAIYLAQYYYNKKNYKKAEYWAMQANIVDSIPEESWIIFAKAKAKSGHRVEALKVLEAYYNKTGSTNALDLIDTIRKNKSF